MNANMFVKNDVLGNIVDCIEIKGIKWVPLSAFNEVCAELSKWRPKEEKKIELTKKQFFDAWEKQDTRVGITVFRALVAELFGE